MIIKPIASGSSGNAYYISDSASSLLLDAGISLKKIQIALNFKLSQINGALISHQHNDHCKSVPDLIKFGINVYGPVDIFNVKKVSGHRCHVVSELKGFTVGSFVVLPFDCQHDCVNYGYLIQSIHTGERLLYFTDTYYIKYRFENLHYIMAECNYSIDAVNESIEQEYIPIQLKKRLLTSHMSLEHFLDMLKANDISNVKQIYLLHLSDNNGREQEFKEAVQRLTGAEVYVC